MTIKIKHLIRLIKTKHQRMFLLAILVSLIIIGAFLGEAYLSKKSEMKLAEKQVGSLAHVLEENSASSFKKIDLVLQDLQVTFQINNHLVQSKKNNDLLSKYKNRLPEILGIKVVDENGLYIADNSGTFAEKNIRDRDYYQKMKSDSIDQLIISIPVLSKSNNVCAVVLSRPILSDKGKFRGLILATISIEHFVNVFSTVDVGQDGSILLMGLDSTFYARRPADASFFGKKVQLAKPMSDFLHSQKQSLIFKKKSTIDGVERVFSARKLKYYPFVLVVGLSTNEILSAWKTRTIINTLFILVVLIVAGIILINFLYSLEELEEQRKQAIQSAKLSTLGEMASGIAHEINNPLTLIVSYANNLKKINLSNANDSKILESANKIIITVDRISKIMKGLRTFGRDSFNDPIVPTSIKKILESTLELFQEQLKDHSIKMSINDFVDFEVNCREVQVDQVLINLLANARDALEGSDNKWVKIEIMEVGNMGVIKFSNSGKKILPEIAEKIMQPFFTTKGVGKGLGLGLSISKGIIEEHGGRFYLDMKETHTTFVIELIKSDQQNIL